jgi:retron-type reverse transcriptase
VEEAIMKGKKRVIDLDLKAYFDSVRHDVLLSKVAARVTTATYCIFSSRICNPRASGAFRKAE